MRIINKILNYIIISLIFAAPVFSQDRQVELTAQEILARADRVLEYPKGQIEGQIIHITPDGRSRTINVVGSITEEDYLFKFYNDDNVNELDILYNMRGEDIWAYQPNAVKLFNKKSIDKYRPILSTNYYYIDLSNADLQSNYNAKITGDAFIKGEDTYSLLLYPIDRTSQYGQLILYVTKKEFIPLRIDYHDTDNVIFKTLSIAKVIKKGNRIIPVRYDMLNIAGGTVTLMEFTSFKEDMKFDKKIFRHQNFGVGE